MAGERDLVVRARGGDADAYAGLVDRHLSSLFGLAFRIVRDRDLADDCVQETFVAAWRDLRALRDPDAFPAWIRQILVRTCRRELATDGRAIGRVRSIDDASEARHVGPDASEGTAGRDEIERAFGRLGPDHRAVVVLYHYERRTAAEIATLLQVPVGTVVSRLHYAHGLLRAAVEADARPVQPRGLA